MATKKDATAAQWLSRYPDQPMKAFWDALFDTSSLIDRDVLMAIVMNPSCGIERKSTRQEGRMHRVHAFVDHDATPLMVAAVANRLDIMKALIDAGADVNAKGTDTALHIAAINRNAEAIEALLSSGAVIDAKGSMAMTPLHRACSSGHEAAVGLLISKGADIEARDCTEATPLHKACASGSPAAVELLLSKGAAIEAMDSAFDTPLCLACSYAVISPGRKGHTAVIEQMLSAGADIRKAGPSLTYICEHNYIEAMKLFFSVGAETEVKSSRGLTPLHQACFDGHVDTIELLLSLGAIVDARDPEGNTPLHIAASCCNLVTVQALLSAGADRNVISKSGAKPLDSLDGAPTGWHKPAGFDAIRELLTIRHGKNGGS